MVSGDIRILIVEDEPGLVDLFEIWLGDHYEVTTATNGEKARSLLDASIDVLILDWRLPDYSGEEIVQFLREDGLEPAIAVVTGAEPDTTNIDDMVDMILQKPISREELQAAISSLIDDQ